MRARVDPGSRSQGQEIRKHIRTYFYFLAFVLFYFNLFYFILCVWRFLCMYVSAVPMETGREHWMCWSYRQFGVAMCMLGIELRSSEQQVLLTVKPFLQLPEIIFKI